MFISEACYIYHPSREDNIAILTSWILKVESSSLSPKCLPIPSKLKHYQSASFVGKPGIGSLLSGWVALGGIAFDFQHCVLKLAPPASITSRWALAVADHSPVEISVTQRFLYQEFLFATGNTLGIIQTNSLTTTQ